MVVAVVAAGLVVDVAGVGATSLAAVSGPTMTTTLAPRTSARGGGVGMALTTSGPRPSSDATARASASKPAAKKTEVAEIFLPASTGASTL